MGVTVVVLLAGLLGAAPPAASGPAKVLLLPLPADASDASRALFEAVSARLATQRGLSLLPWPKLTLVSSIAGDERLRTEIDEGLARVQDAYRRLDVAEATRLLQSLENARLSELGCPERIALAGRISFWMGVVYAAKKDTARATERFATVLSIDPAYVIDAKYFPPVTVALFEKVRKSQGAAQTGGLSLSVEPEAARVFLNGQGAGQAPVTLSAADGDHFVCVRRVGWKDWAARLHLTAGRVDTQRIYLQRASTDEVALQLGAVLGSGPAQLDDPTHLDALGAALSADVVAEVRAPATLAWREVKAPSEAHQVVAPSPTAPAQTVSEALALAFSEELGVQPARVAKPVAPAVVFRRFDMEAAASGGVTFGLRGFFVGGRLGLWWNVSPSVALGVRAGVARGYGEVGLFDPTPAEKLVLGSASENFEVPLSVGLRWHFLHAGALRLSFEGNATLRLLNYASPTTTTNLPLAITDLSTIRFSTLGAHLGMLGSYALHPAFALFFGVDYGLEVALPRPDVSAVLTPRDGSSPLNLHLSTEPVRHMVSFDVGVQLRFE